MINKVSLWLLIIPLVVLLLSCTESLPEDDDPTLPNKYEYTVMLKCFCFQVGPYDLEVLYGEIVSFESRESDLEEFSNDFIGSLTID